MHTRLYNNYGKCNGKELAGVLRTAASELPLFRSAIREAANRLDPPKQNWQPPMEKL
jgi:hypothetical protein